MSHCTKRYRSEEISPAISHFAIFPVLRNFTHLYKICAHEWQKKELTHPSNLIMQKRHFGPKWKGRRWLFAFLQKTFNCQPRAPIMCAFAAEVTLFHIQNHSQFCGQDSQEKVPEEAVIQPIGSFASYVSKSHSKISPDSLKAIHWLCEGCECKVYLQLLCLCISWLLVADEKASAAERPRM